ncbi:AAA family ATPase [Shewanella sp. BC20]|uniref:AAA family ATPase n=1 Tax=Shewanella sp. BC20 TaxID=2004459 RepID=UPI0015E7EEC7|nr:AAA family ATPase [Shewanella sp. BC20]
MQVKIKQPHKSISSMMEFELPFFTVLTGENGSGKTHLFEAINNSRANEVIVEGKVLKSIRYIPFGGLNPTIEQQCESGQVLQLIKYLWQDIYEAQQRCNANYDRSIEAETIEKDPVYRLMSNSRHKASLLSIFSQTGIMPSKLTEDIVAEKTSMMDVSENNILNTQLALIFKAYHIRHVDNLLNKVYQDSKIPDAGPYLSPEEFEREYGEPPWVLVNSILEKLKLPYKVNNPMGTKRDSTFNFKLIHNKSCVEINTNDLSTGEKTLMSLALAIYNSNGKGERAELLILDEPDAPLHPSMSKIMLEIIEEEIVKKHGIPVLLSTHSPATVAYTPANALYKITLNDKRPQQCNLEDSMKILTYGIPNFRVSTESRRQVFVEHSNDVTFYESLFDIISRKVEFTTVPQFLPPHTLNGSNCEAVIEITRKLRNLGNRQVYGLIDWDLKNTPEDQIIILGGGKRYAIENYIFEPHFIGLYLIHKKFASPEELGLKGCSSYFEASQLIASSNVHLQTLTDTVESKISWKTDEVKVNSILVGGWSLNIRRDFYTTQGHELEEMYKATWKKLNKVRENNASDATLKKDIIITVMNDFPELISQDLADTIKKFE